MQKPSSTIAALGLRSLRTLECAGRLLNFTRAAEELCLTTAAVSHQIRATEAQLGVVLFRREARALRLTPEGETILHAVGKAIAVLEQAIAQLRSPRQADQVRVSAAPSIAAKWLVPRLERFLQQHPAADIRVDVSIVEVDFAHEQADLSIRYGRVQAAQARMDRLFVESVFPVCSPRLLGRHSLLQDARELLRYKLIHVDWDPPHRHWPDWATWMKAAGVGDVPTRRGIHFQQTSLAIEAAVAGQGIALGESSLVADDLARGRLVKPFARDIPVVADWAYYLVTRQQALSVPLVRSFRQWLLQEARATPGGQDAVAS